MARRRLRRVLGYISLLVIGVVIAFSWPTSLGGMISYVQVSGASMEPTYLTGDLVVTREAPAYRTGDPIVYRVPEGDVGAGAQVLHRIVGGNGRVGFKMRGDNNEYNDTWKPRRGDVVGRVILHVPRAGVWVAYWLDRSTWASCARA